MVQYNKLAPKEDPTYRCIALPVQLDHYSVVSPNLLTRAT